jgi:hypothetical protein
MTLCYDIILGASMPNAIMKHHNFEHQNAERHYTKCSGANLWIFQRVIDTFFVSFFFKKRFSTFW